MKKIYYSYLLNRERDLTIFLTAHWSTKKQAFKARRSDISMKACKPGKLVKITLETIDD